MKPRHVLVLMSILLPMNVLFFFESIGTPSYTNLPQVADTVGDTADDEMRAFWTELEKTEEGANMWMSTWGEASYADPRYREALQEILFAGEVQERGWEVKLESEINPETASVTDSSDTLEVNRDSWIVYEHVSDMVPPTSLLTITSHECYVFGSAEYNLLGRLQYDGARAKCERECLSSKREAICRDDPQNAIALCSHCKENCEDLKRSDGKWAPETWEDSTGLMKAYIVRQGACESLFAHAMIHRVAELEDDTWDEIFDLTLRLFAAVAGILADTSLGGAGGDFLEDISDIVDMYLWSFQDVTQLHEGRTLFDPYARAWNRGADYKTTSNLSFMNVCLRLITIAYISLVYRAMSCLQLIPLMDTCITRIIQMTPLMDGASEGRRTEHSQNSEWETEEVQEGLSKWHSFLSLVLIEIPFLVLRVYAFVNNSVPIGILALKNIHNIYYDLSKIFPRLSINESGEGNVPDCRHGMDCKHTDLRHFKKFQHPSDLFDLLPDSHPAKTSIDIFGSVGVKTF
jgi:hypothetical protein